jgi:hypothetical protein
MRTVGLIVSITLFLQLHAWSVCLVPQPRLVCAEFFESRAVVIAKLTRGRHVEFKNSDTDGHLYYFATEQRLRGKIPTTFRVFDENSSGRATFEWKIGDSYVLFLDFDDSKGAWVLDNCGNSGPMQSASRTLTEIKALNTRTNGGEIRGVVTENGISGDGLTGVEIVALSDGRRFAATTDANGSFRLRVPVGRYRLRVLKKGLSFDTADISYLRADNVRVENGSCPQIQFVGHKLGEPR